MVAIITGGVILGVVVLVLVALVVLSLVLRRFRRWKPSAKHIRRRSSAEETLASIRALVAATTC